MGTQQVTSFTTSWKIMSVSASYAGARNASYGNTPDASYPGAQNYYDNVSLQYYVSRVFLDFYLYVPTYIAITAATLSIYGDSFGREQHDSGQANLRLYQGTQTTNPVYTDFDNFGTTLLSDDLTNWNYPISNSSYNAVNINSSGLALINLNSAHVKYCIRTAGDVNNSTPTGQNLQGITSGINQAKLVVTYTVNTEYAPDPLTPKLGMRHKYPVLYKNGIQVPNPSGSSSAKDGLHVSEGRKATFKRNSYLRDMG